MSAFNTALLASIWVLATWFTLVSTVQAEPFAYIAGVSRFGVFEVYVVDLETNALSDTITLGGHTVGGQSPDIDVSTSGNYACVITDWWLFGPDGFLYILDLSTNTIDSEIALGDDPLAVAISPSGETIFVTNMGPTSSSPGYISVIDKQTTSVIGTIPVGRLPLAVEVTPDGRYVYVANTYGEGTVSVVNTTTNSVDRTISTGTNYSGPQGIVFTPDGAYAYVYNGFDGTVSVIETSSNTEIDIIEITSNPPIYGAGDIAITSDGEFVFVATYDEATVFVVATDNNEIIDRIAVPYSRARSIALSPDNEFAYVTQSNNDPVSVIDTSVNAVTDTFWYGFLLGTIAIPVSANPVEIIGILANYILNLKGQGKIHEGTAKSLLAKLDVTLMALENENTQSACNILQALVNSVHAQYAKKVTPSIADDLLTKIGMIRSELDCG